MSIIPIQSFHLTLTDSQMIKEYIQCMQKNKGNNDDTANAKALASTSETSVGNVPFNSSISKYSDNVKKFSLDVDRFSNDLRNAQLWQYDGYEHFF